MRANEMRERTDDELEQLLVDGQDDLMHFRLQRATGVVDNVKGAQQTRKDIARIRTILNERNRSGGAAASGDDD